MLDQIPLLDALRGKMQWLGARQRVLSDNVANSQTPKYQAKELEAFDFSSFLGRAQKSSDPGTLRRTNAGHIGLRGPVDAKVKIEEDKDFWEATPNGNNVVLEDQMMKVAQNQMQFDSAISLYKKSMAMMRRAVSSKE